MKVTKVFVTTADAPVRIVDVAQAAREISVLSGAQRWEIAEDLRGGITFECGGIVWAPDAVAALEPDARVTHPIDASEGAR